MSWNIYQLFTILLCVNFIALTRLTGHPSFKQLKYKQQYVPDLFFIMSSNVMDIDKFSIVNSILFQLLWHNPRSYQWRDKNKSLTKTNCAQKRLSCILRTVPYQPTCQCFKWIFEWPSVAHENICELQRRGSSCRKRAHSLSPKVTRTFFEIYIT